jgi:hypothetical protein
VKREDYVIISSISITYIRFGDFDVEEADYSIKVTRKHTE